MKNIKKKIKGIALAAVICVVVTALTGCFSLQELKDKQAYFDDEGNICVGNYKYIAIKIGDELTPEIGSFNEVYVCEEDVPLLLTPMLGISYLVSNDGIFIDGDEGYYCREDKYEEVSLTINKEYIVKGYRYSYFDLEKDEQCKGELSEEEAQIINTILKEVKGIKDGDIMYDDGYVTSCDVLSYGESKHLVREEFSIEFGKNKTYFVKYLDDDESILVYDIPAKYHSRLREMFKPVLESEFDLKAIF